MKQYSTLIFDFNGTLVDDLDLCLDILNRMLVSNGHEPVTKQQYLDVFNFPIRDYYAAVGFDLEGKEPFEELAKVFDAEYRAQFPSLSLFGDVMKVLSRFEKKYRLMVLSATKQKELENQVRFLGIDKYFSALIGIKDIYAFSKVSAGQNYFDKHPELKQEQVLFIGDTLHDAEVAKALHGDCVLVARGHQSRKRLEKAAPVVDTLEDLIPLLG